MTALRSVIFDLDGTLVDIAGATARRVNRLAAASNATEIAADPIRAAQRATQGARPRFARWVARAIAARGGTPLSPRVIAQDLRHVGRDLEPDPRVLDVVTRVSRAFRIAVVTNGPRDFQREKLRAAGLVGLFAPSRVFVSGELGIRKPDARIFRRALEATGAPSEATLFVGDDEMEDIEGARAVGMRTCRIAPSGTATSADARIDHVADLLGVLPCAT